MHAGELLLNPDRPEMQGTMLWRLIRKSRDYWCVFCWAVPMQSCATLYLNQFQVITELDDEAEAGTNYSKLLWRSNFWRGICMMECSLQVALSVVTAIFMSVCPYLILHPFSSLWIWIGPWLFSLLERLERWQISGCCPGEWGFEFS